MTTIQNMGTLGIQKWETCAVAQDKMIMALVQVWPPETCGFFFNICSKKKLNRSHKPGGRTQGKSQNLAPLKNASNSPRFTPGNKKFSKKYANLGLVKAAKKVRTTTMAVNCEEWRADAAGCTRMSWLGPARPASSACPRCRAAPRIPGGRTCAEAPQQASV